MRQLRSTKVVAAGVVVATLSACAASVAAGQYWPRWDKPKPVDRGHRVGRTDRPLAFEVFRIAMFDNEREAAAFAAKQAKVLRTNQIDERFQVQFVGEMDLTSIVPPEQVAFWSAGKPNYFLYRSLSAHYVPTSKIEDGVLCRYLRNTYRSRESAVADASYLGELIKCDPVTLPDGSTHWATLHCKRIDLLAEARTLWENNELAEKHLILEDIGPFECRGAHAPMVMEGGRAPGRMMGIGYLRTDLPGKGCNVYLYLADGDDGLDHDFLRYFVMQVGVAVEEYGDGQVVVVGTGGRPTAWKASPRAYYRVAGSQDRELVLDAYLKKFPSILPADYTVDTNAWAREELRRIVERMRALVDGDTEDGTRYLGEYDDFCKWIEPPSGAPAFPPDAPFDRTLRAYHFARLDAWWQQHKDALEFRKGAPLSQREVIRTMPNRTDLLKKALDDYRKVVEEHEKEAK